MDATYHYDYTDLQLLVAEPTSTAGISVAFYGNAPSAEIDGAEIEGSLAISDMTSIDFSAAYTDARYTEYSPFPGFSFAGASLDRAPEWVLGGTLNHDIALGGSNRLRFSVGTRWSDDYVMSAFGAGYQVRQESYFKSDASITFAMPSESLIMQAFVRNIEDYVEANYALSGPGYFPFPTGPTTGEYTFLDGGVVSFGTPRTFGLRLSKSF